MTRPRPSGNKDPSTCERDDPELREYLALPYGEDGLIKPEHRARAAELRKRINLRGGLYSVRDRDPEQRAAIAFSVRARAIDRTVW